MINNNFFLMGVVVDFEKQDKLSVLRLEVEKTGVKFGKSFEVVVVIPMTNNTIDLEQDYIGHFVAINGYIDSKTNDNGSLFTNLIAQKLLVLDTKEIEEAYAK